MPGLVGAQPLVLDHAGIVLHGSVGDHHVADAQGGIEPAGDAREHDQPAAEPVRQERRDQRRVDLADPGADQHHLVAVEPAQVEAGMRHTDRLGVLQRVAQMGQLLGDGADQADGHGRGSSRRRAPELRRLAAASYRRHMGARQEREGRTLDRQLIGIDHLIVGVRDLEAARAQYARLGFNSTPRGRHVGWGTANYCIMFEHDYLELLGIVDAGQFTNGLDRFLERREGLLGRGARAAATPRRPRPPGCSGPAPERPKALGRLLEREGGAVELRFRNVHAAARPHRRAQPVRLRAPDARADAPPGLARPPERRPGDPLLHHRRLRRCARWPRRYAGCSARPRSPRTDNVVAAHTGHGVILVAPPEDADADASAARPAGRLAEPRPVALTLEVADPDRTAAFLRLQGVRSPARPSGDVLVPPAEAHGVALELVRADHSARNRRPACGCTLDPCIGGQGEARRLGATARPDRSLASCCCCRAGRGRGGLGCSGSLTRSSRRWNGC